MIVFIEPEKTRKNVEFLLKNNLSIYRKGGPYESIKKEKRKEIDHLMLKIKNRDDSSEENWSLLCEIGTLYEHLKEPYKAINFFKRAANARPNSVTVLDRLALNYYEIGDYANSTITFIKIVEILPNRASSYYNIACLYSKQDQAEEAARWLKTAIEKGYQKIEKIKSDADLTNLRESQYFEDILLKINQQPNS